MNQNLGRIKFVIFLASLILLSLIGLVVFQLVTINRYQQKIDKQQSQIEQLNNQLDYYKNHSSLSGDGSDIVLGGQE